MVRNFVNTGSKGMRARRIHYISTLLDWLDLLSHHLVTKPKLAEKLLVNLTQKCQIKSKSRKDVTFCIQEYLRHFLLSLEVLSLMVFPVDPLTISGCPWSTIQLTL